MFWNIQLLLLKIVFKLISTTYLWKLVKFKQIDQNFLTVHQFTTEEPRPPRKCPHVVAISAEHSEKMVITIVVCVCKLAVVG